MTRTITPAEIKPGMTIRWETQMEIKSTTKCNGVGGVLISGDNRITEYLDSDAKITVLSEPTPVQPEEPTEFGEKVIVDGEKFLRAPLHSSDLTPWLRESDGTWRNWATILAMGPVTVVPDQGWTVPDDAPEVPERIEEWPEADEHLRKHKWRDMDGDTWTWAKAEDKWECRSRADIRMGASRRPGSWFGPFTRVTDA